jgi:hypothetical protein
MQSLDCTSSQVNIRQLHRLNRKIASRYKSAHYKQLQRQASSLRDGAKRSDLSRSASLYSVY